MLIEEGAFAGLERNGYGAIMADPPWSFRVWSKDTGNGRSAESHYGTMSMSDIAALQVADLAAEDSVLFMWACWPSLPEALSIIEAWGFTYKTCAFAWTKADARQPEFFHDDVTPYMGLGYWTRANSEVCLLATRGKPKRLNADVRQAIIEPRREHSRKPDCVPSRIERLVEGPYLELFARTQRENWTCWGNEVGKFSSQPEAGHPVGDHSQLGGARIPLQVVTPPADNLDVPEDIAIQRSEAINAR